MDGLIGLYMLIIPFNTRQAFVCMYHYNATGIVKTIFYYLCVAHILHDHYPNQNRIILERIGIISFSTAYSPV
jgi:hypothetical protein